MRRLIRNPETGIVEVWESSRKIGEILTMGDQGGKEPEKKKKEDRK